MNRKEKIEGIEGKEETERRESRWKGERIVSKREGCRRGEDMNI